MCRRARPSLVGRQVVRGPHMCTKPPKDQGDRPRWAEQGVKFEHGFGCHRGILRRVGGQSSLCCQLVAFMLRPEAGSVPVGRGGSLRSCSDICAPAPGRPHATFPPPAARAPWCSISRRTPGAKPKQQLGTLAILPCTLAAPTPSPRPEDMLFSGRAKVRQRPSHR